MEKIKGLKGYETTEGWSYPAPEIRSEAAAFIREVRKALRPTPSLFRLSRRDWYRAVFLAVHGLLKETGTVLENELSALNYVSDRLRYMAGVRDSVDVRTLL